MSVPGGYHSVEVTQEAKDLVAHNVAGINAKLGAHHTSFTVDNVSSQVVAGTNYFFHLTADNGAKVSATIYVPLPHTNSPAEVTDAHDDHVEPHHHSH